MPTALAVPQNHNQPQPGSTASSATLVGGRSTHGDAAYSFVQVDSSMNNSNQVNRLNEELLLQTQIKDGAENLLLDNGLPEKERLEIRSELEMASYKINYLQHQIGLQSSRSPERSNGASVPQYANAPRGSRHHLKDGDDKSADGFKSSLQSATSCIKELVSLLHPTDIRDVNSQRLTAMTKLLNILRRNLRVRYEIDFAEVLRAIDPCFGDRASMQCRAVAYRIVRHSLIDSDTVQKLGDSLDWYFVKSLLRDNKHAAEKEQVIKLIRAIVELGTTRRDPETKSGPGTVPVSETVMRAVIAVAEHPEDPFRLICIQTLSEILMIDIELAARTGVIRFLISVMGDGPVEMAPILASIFLQIVDSPRTRAFIQVGMDLEVALSAITDAYGKGPDHAERMKGCAKVVQLMLRTWSGLMFFCMDDMRAIKSLIDTLRIPSLDTREIILDMFFDLLNIKTPEWYKTFIDGRRLTMYRKTHDSSENLSTDNRDTSEKQHHTLKLTDQYLALLLAVLVNAGLLEALKDMLEESITGTNLSRKANLLLAESLSMANKVLPLPMAADIQTVPGVFNLAVDYKDGENRIVGTSALSAIDSFNRNRTRLEPSALIKGFRPRANSVEDAVRRGQRQVEQVKLKISMQMDDKAFQACLLETQVMVAPKDHTKWNFDTLLELVEGPLYNPKRLEEGIRVSRFVRRLMSFFHPFSHRFSDMKRSKANAKWVRLGCSLLTTLMSTPEGVRYLATDDQLLVQIVKSFAQLDPFNGVPDSDPILSKKRIADTLTYGYLDMLGTLSKYKDGIELLEKHKIFTAFYHLSELRSREDLIKGIIENLDYSIDGHPRIVLSKALTSSYKHIRLYATRHLGSLIRNATSANAWTLRLLLTQLYDPQPEVCELAVEYLEEACDSKEILQLVVEMQPTMDHLGDIGHRLLLKFMSTPIGFRFLFDASYIDREMESWFNGRNIDYVVEVEVFLAKVFNFSSIVEDEEDIVEFDGTVPAHFYGEMAKTELGCQVLQEKGHFSEFAEFIRQHSHENEDPDLILKLKSILWAVGNIGSSEGGLHFCEEEEIIPAILDIAETSLIPSVRGTCFFVLGLIASTSQGAEILDDYHWEATLSPLGLPTGLCIPEDISRFISLPSWQSRVPKDDENRLLPPTAEHELEAITAIQNLANTVIANAASRSLARIKAKAETKGIFSSPEMLYRALHIMSTHRYRLPVRRYIMELFSQEFDHDLVSALNDAAVRLKASPSYKPPRTDTIRMSVFGRVGKSRRPSESDDSDEDVGTDTLETETKPVPDQQIFNLQPVTKVVGFDA